MTLLVNGVSGVLGVAGANSRLSTPLQDFLSKFLDRPNSIPRVNFTT
jgi:hypothetical protein